jgi:N6-L-threonylcarbamoyladenine synthase
MPAAFAPTRLTLLGLESSCDETAAAVVRWHADAAPAILSSEIAAQTDLHAAFGGVVPEIAARAHAEKLDLMVERALEVAGLGLGELDAVAVTAGPGLIGGVMAGVMCAKGIAWGAGLPLIGVNHLAGHALTPRLTDGLAFPYLMLLVSGGHCQFLRVEGAESFHRLGGTIDDAPGEAFDKVARLLGLPQPGGPSVEREAASGDPARFAFPRPLLDRPGCDLSFSGLKTAVLRARDDLVASEGGLPRRARADLCAGFQAAVAEVLAEKSRRALAACSGATGDGTMGAGKPGGWATGDFPTGGGATAFAVAGGVAANGAVRRALSEVAAAAGIPFVAPPLRLCTDNAAMIAWAGIERLRLGRRDGFDLPARPRWPLDGGADPMLGGGRKGAKA